MGRQLGNRNDFGRANRDSMPSMLRQNDKVVKWKMNDDYCEDEEFKEEDEIETPEDCPFGGAFSPGTEDCDFCEWYDVCEENFRKIIRVESRKHRKRKNE